MKCRDAHEMINSYFDNNIDPMNDRHLADHIKSCPECRAELDFLNKYRDIIKTVKPVSPPDNFLSEIHRKIELDKAANPLKKIYDAVETFLSSFRFPLEAAGVLAIAAFVFFLYKPFFNNQKVQESTSEYAVVSPRDAAQVKKDHPAKSAVPERKAFIQKAITEKKQLPPVREITKTESSADDMADIKPAAELEKDYATAAKSDMKESLPVEREKKLKKNEENSFYDESIASKGALSERKESVKSPGYDAERLFSEYKVSVIKKNLSDPDRIYYRIKVNGTKHPLLIKRLKEEYTVEEKITKKSPFSVESDLFLGKNKK